MNDTDPGETVALEIHEFGTNQLVRRIELQPHNRNERYIERCMSGLLMQMDSDRFYIKEVDQ